MRPTSIQGRYDSFTFDTRLDFESKFIQGMFQQAFFPELANAFMDHLVGNEFEAYLTTVLVNDATVSWVALGVGEEMINKALINLYTMMGAYKLSL